MAHQFNHVNLENIKKKHSIILVKIIWYFME